MRIPYLAHTLRRAVVVPLLTLLFVGCNRQPPQFKLDRIYLQKLEDEYDAELFPPELRQKMVELLTDLFGTPDDPRLPDVDIADVLDIEKVKLASGPLSSDQSGTTFGLYRKHCVQCHGITGDGIGPTAPLLNPYPRDFRMGKFKYKSTPLGYKPTGTDLRYVVNKGLPGTAMPAFRLLGDDEQDALVHYVRYLAIRGEVERDIMIYVADMDEDDWRGEESPFVIEYINDEIVRPIVHKWRIASSKVTIPPPRPDYSAEEKLASIERGRDLYDGPTAKCVSCHGISQLGDGQTDGYDDWTTDLLGTTNHDPDKVAKFESLGMLPPRNLLPRNLRQGIFRGGNHASDIYRRIQNGIEGTTMPGALMKSDDQPDAIGLSSQDVWDLVNYLQHLPQAKLSQSSTDAATKETSGE